MSKRSVKKAVFQIAVTLPAGMNLKKAEERIRERLAADHADTSLMCPVVKLISHETVYL